MVAQKGDKREQQENMNIRKDKEKCKERNSEKETIVVNREIDETMMEKLSRSVVGETTNLVNIDVMVERLF